MKETILTRLRKAFGSPQRPTSFGKDGILDEFMSFPPHSRKTLYCWLWTLLSPLVIVAQTNYAPQGTEYQITGSTVGDQVHPDLAIRDTGGLVVWQDNFSDGDGYGIKAMRLDSSLSAAFSSFRVNQQGALDQERPRVSLLANGGAVIVWQGGKQGFQNIYARFLTPSNTWWTGDILVNTFTNNTRMNPSVVTLAGGEVVVVWGSFGQEAVTHALQGVYAQRFSAAGEKLGGEFAVNQTKPYNQRNPSIAPLHDGRFAVVWVSEQQSFSNSVGIYGRIFNANGAAAGDEFLISTSTNVCASPAIAAPADGGFMVTWSEREPGIHGNGWDIYSRAFSDTAAGGLVRRVNTTTYGDQHSSRLGSLGADYFVVWTSLGHDGSREGVYGRVLASDGTTTAPEFRVNTTVVNQQLQPRVASDPSGRFLVVWSSFADLTSGMDLAAQRYASVWQPLPAPDAPFVTVIASNALSVTWPSVAGFPVAAYEVYADGDVAATTSTTNTIWTANGLAASSTHAYRLAYVLSDGRRSPLSAPSTGTTYGAGPTYGGIPQEWMGGYFGNDSFAWPSPYVDTDGDGASNLQEFRAGTDPTDANSVLRTRLTSAAQGLYLNWNTQPGLVYQVVSTTNMTTWFNVGGARFAAGYLDSIYLSQGTGNIGYYQILRLR